MSGASVPVAELRELVARFRNRSEEELSDPRSNTWSEAALDVELLAAEAESLPPATDARASGRPSVPLDDLAALDEELQRNVDASWDKRPDFTAAMSVARAKLLDVVARTAFVGAPPNLAELRAAVREADRLGGLDGCHMPGCSEPRCAAVARLRGLV